MKDGIVLFDAFAGFGGAELSADYAGVKVKKRYISEINKDAIKVLKKHYPDAIFVGDIRDLDPKDFKDVTHITGGSPCTDLSFAGKKRGMVTKGKNIEIYTMEQYMELKKDNFEFVGQSFLFYEYCRMYFGIKEIQERENIEVLKFFLENVKMTEKWENVITNILKVKPLKINASSVSAQNRYRLYWTDFAHNITFPEDLGINLCDVIEDAVTGVGFRGRKLDDDEFYSYPKTVRDDFKANCLTTKMGSISKDGNHYGTSFYKDKRGKIKQLTLAQAEILMGLPEGYTNVEGVSKTARERMIGNGWSVYVTGRLFKYIDSKYKILNCK
jgi:DNA (cytosine-5)-methyltransferase 3A